MEALLFLVILSCAASAQGQTSCSTEGDIRLQGLISLSGGRVEVCVGGVWGTICDSAAWSQKNALVACRQISFGVLAYNSFLPNTLPNSAAATPETPIHYRNVMCTGTEESVSNCTLTMDNTGCTHDDDVGIFCRTSEGEGDIRLLGDAMNGVGAVEIYEGIINGWRTICPDSSVWNDDTANAACVQLGYESGTAENFSLPTVPVGIGSIAVEGITCEADDFTLQECDITYSSINPPSCSVSTGMYAGVRCQSSNQPAGSLRLFGANSTTQGRVEILYSGRWGAVCDTLWDDGDGEVACRQLGVRGAVDTNPFTADYRGTSDVKPIWLSRLQCDSTESALMNCSRLDSPIGFSAFCNDHSDVAALVCGADDSGGLSLHSATSPLLFIAAAVHFFVRNF